MKELSALPLTSSVAIIVVQVVFFINQFGSQLTDVILKFIRIQMHFLQAYHLKITYDKASLKIILI